jgi:hypothetical protein
MNLQEHFPKRGDAEAVKTWTPILLRRPLSARVMCVAATRIEGAWSAYVDSVAGLQHEVEWQTVRENGTKLDEPIARAVFPEFADVPYAR